MKKVVKLVPFSIYDVSMLQSWLAKNARHGRKFCKGSRIFAVFQKDQQSKTLCYKIIQRGKSVGQTNPCQTQMSFAGHFGKYFDVYKADTEQAEPSGPFTYEFLWKKMRATLAVCILSVLLAISAIITVWTKFRRGEVKVEHILSPYGMWEIYVIVVFLVCGIFLALRYRKIRRLHNFREKSTSTLNKKHIFTAAVGHFARIAVCVLLICSMAYSGWNCVTSAQNSFRLESEQVNRNLLADKLYISIQDAFPQSNLLHDNNSTINIKFHESPTLLAPTHYSIEQYCKELDLFFSVEEYCVVLDGFAQALYAEKKNLYVNGGQPVLMNYAVVDRGLSTMLSEKYYFDRFEILGNDEYERSSRVIIACKGKRLLCIAYGGDTAGNYNCLEKVLTEFSSAPN